MDLKKIASVAGKPGLFQVEKPTRTGVILVPIDGQGGRFVAGANSRVSVLQEISIYTTDEAGSVPLSDVLHRLYDHQQGQAVALLPRQASEGELRGFMAEVLPGYDADRVYASDIKKLITWYNLLLAHRPDMFEAPPADEAAGAPANDAPASDEPQANAPADNAPADAPAADKSAANAPEA